MQDCFIVIGSIGVTVRQEVFHRAVGSPSHFDWETPAFSFRPEIQPSGWMLGTEGPVACAKWVFERAMKVPRHKSAIGKTTLKFLCM